MQNEQTTELTIAEKLDAIVLPVISQKQLSGFTKAYQRADAIIQLRELLTDEYMKPIMALQGSRLGFRTDKDRNKDGSKGPGYSMEIVRECVIEAVLKGLQPTGNEFNIIAGNCYETKEGCGVLLNKIDGLRYSIITGLPRISQDKTSCAFEVDIRWSYAGTEYSEKVPIPIKIDSYASVDSMVGKATRKARAWLLSRITGEEVTDGEVEDAEAKVVSSRPLGKTDEEKEYERMILCINNCATLDELNLLRNANPDFPVTEYDRRAEEIKAKK